jgi:iron complex transport system ATP-binding protein
MNLFNLENVSAGYESDIVIKNISLSIGQGEFISIIGPNGSGKSTLLKTISGQIKPLSGNVFYRDLPIGSFRKIKLAREFSFIHSAIEDSAPFTVQEFVSMGLFPFRKFLNFNNESDKIIIDEALEMTDIPHLKKRLVTELSAGERQLALLAQSLVQNRNIILMDEPVSHLDVKHTTDFMDILYRLNKSGSTIISILHDINIASDYSGRIIGLKKGEIFFNGSPEKVVKYKLIEELFGTVCVVLKNPITGKPFSYSVPEHAVSKSRKKS